MQFINQEKNQGPDGRIIEKGNFRWNFYDLIILEIYKF